MAFMQDVHVTESSLDVMSSRFWFAGGAKRVYPPLMLVSWIKPAAQTGNMFSVTLAMEGRGFGDSEVPEV